MSAMPFFGMPNDGIGKFRDPATAARSERAFAERVRQLRTAEHLPADFCGGVSHSIECGGERTPCVVPN